MKFLMLLIAISGLAEDIKYTLKKSGDTISKRLIEEEYIDSKYETQKIKEVLDYNTLDWIKARSLPVGFDFYIKREDKKIVHVTESDPLKMKLGAGVFYHTQDDNKSEIFSDLSQYLDSHIEYKNYYLGLRLDHLVYSVDEDQNIVSDRSFLNYLISVGKKISFLNLGIYSNSFITYKTDSLNQVGISKKDSSGIEIGLSKHLFTIGDIKTYGKLNLKYALVGSSFLDLSLSLENRFRFMNKSMSVDFTYNTSKVEDDYLDQRASSGLSLYF